MPSDSVSSERATLDAVRRAHLVLVAAHEHFQQLLSALSEESRAVFHEEVAPEAHRIIALSLGVSAPALVRHRPGENNPTRKAAARRRGSGSTLKGLILAVVEHHPRGLPLDQLIEAVLREYRPPRTKNVRHVVRTMINQLFRKKDVLMNEEGLYIPFPF